MFFFPFLFPRYCHSVVYHVVSIVSDGCNQSAYFLCSPRVVVSIYQRCLQCWQVFFLPRDTFSLSTSSLWCNTLFMVIIFLVICCICLNTSLVHFRKALKYLTRDICCILICRCMQNQNNDTIRTQWRRATQSFPVQNGSSSVQNGNSSFHFELNYSHYELENV